MDLTAALEKARQELLELTARNRLVHTPLQRRRTSWLSVIDERSDALFDLLVRQGKTMSFAPAPEDTEDDPEEFLKVFDGEQQPDGEIPEQVDADDDVDLDEEIDGETGLAPTHVDRWLQTRLNKEPLQGRLLRMFYDARSAEQEQGVSILYLACGFLRWREAQNSDVNRYAPLLLIPVELSRNTARSKFRLRYRDDEIVTNLSIQARLQQDFGIRLPDIPDDARDDESWNPRRYFDSIRELIEDRPDWEVIDDEILLWFFSFTKFLMFRDLQVDAWPEHNGLNDNELVRGLLADGFDPSQNLQPIVADSEPIDPILNPADVIHVSDADSSQAVVIEEIARGRNLVVQGPPGTGKSQTITNAIAAAVHAGRRVLFVSEKMAALEVVKRRLDQIGLGPMVLELHSHKARKKQVLQELKATLDSGVPTGTVKVPIDELRDASLRLRFHDGVLHNPVGRTGHSPYQAMGQLLRLKSSGANTPPYVVAAATGWDPRAYQERKRLAGELDQLLEVIGVPNQNTWRGVGCQPLTPMDLQRLIERLREIQTQITTLDQSTSRLAEVLGVSPPEASLISISQLGLLATHLQQRPIRFDAEAILDAAWERDRWQLQRAADNLRQLQRLRATTADKVAEAAWHTDLAPTRIALAAHGQSWLRFLRSDYRRAMATLRGICSGDPPGSLEERIALVDSILEIQSRTKDLESSDSLCQRALGSLWSGQSTIVDDFEAVTEWVKKGGQSEFIEEHQRQVAARLSDRRLVDKPLEELQAHLKQTNELISGVVNDLKLDVDAAFAESDPQRIALAAWQERFQAWLQQPEQLSDYLAAMARLRQLRESELVELAGEVQRGEVAAGDAADRLALIFNEAVLAEAWQTRPALAQFHGTSYEKLRARFAQLDQQRIGLSRLNVAKKHYAGLPDPSASGGQVNIVKREINKKRRHKPLRVLIREAGEAIQRIKPVFMMSPLSVAQYLEPGTIDFDLLVIDEASQVQPVDALGAIARCKQIVVVGDQKQLPPTNFFDRIAGDQVDDDEADSAPQAGDMESILGLCEAQGLPNRLLRWHYRSRHESLIAVSNRQFYDDRLFIVPSPLISGGPLGLKFRFVRDGWYDRGGSRVNRPEAIAVADAVVDHARTRPDMSLGVATFSSAQRDAIIDELELRRRADPGLEDFFASGGPEPFFVKSLENVQGDQRDIIFISIGYAKDRDGYFTQNFGPLNRKGGERRLNVLISRAAAACQVFSSLQADDIDLSRTSSEGVAALKMYLRYAEHGRLDDERSTGAAESVFEQQVAEAIRAQGLEVDHQIGVGGFYIDLAIRDPQQRGRYLLGIECDGAQYHSARWVRDRDRLRQQILEARGWHIHRVWSTDWFQRSEQELQKVNDALTTAREHWDKVDADEAVAATLIAGRVRMPALVCDSLWERVDAEDTEEPADAKPGSPYRQADFKVRGVSGGPNDLRTDQLATLAERIVKIEGPIHLDEIARRCIAILGSGRLTARVKRNIRNAVHALQAHRRADTSGSFVTIPNQPIPMRNRRSIDNANLRKTEYLPPEELSAAVTYVVSEHIGTDVAETSSSVAKLLGVNNSKAFQQVVRKQIKWLTDNHVLESRSGKLFQAAAND